MLTLFLHRIARDGPNHRNGLRLLNELVDFGADLNAVDNFKHSALYLAVKRGHIDTAKRLIALKVRCKGSEPRHRA